MSLDEQLRAALATQLEPVHLELINESHLHAGHTGHGGASHFRVFIVSGCFEGQNRVARQRMVYAAAQDFIPEKVHALAIRALTPNEFHSSETTS